jgi:ParB family chromosome partitioning protein
LFPFTQPKEALMAPSIDDLAAPADAARAPEACPPVDALIVELDPAMIDPSFICDRMEPEDESYELLRDSIAVMGQSSPILVRPHPVTPGRYQVAFGHRRLRAVAALGRPARCIVKPLTDRDLVIAQGQENSARADLSFIERGRFAQTLKEAGYDRETIMQALSIDKSTLSRLISVARRLPTDIVDAVGPAPTVGRHRWMSLATAFFGHVRERPVDPLLESEDFLTAPSDRRFEMLHAHLTQADARPMRRPKPAPWFSTSGARVATVAVTDQNFILTIDRTVARDFGQFLIARMGALYEDYRVGRQPRTPFRHSTLR